MVTSTQDVGHLRMALPNGCLKPSSSGGYARDESRFPGEFGGVCLGPQTMAVGVDWTLVWCVEVRNDAQRAEGPGVAQAGATFFEHILPQWHRSNRLSAATGATAALAPTSALAGALSLHAWRRLQHDHTGEWQKYGSPTGSTFQLWVGDLRGPQNSKLPNP